ncbi:hypothetical protein ABXS75_14190 [Roseburia hominis]
MTRQIYWEKGEFNIWVLLLCAYHFFPFITVKGSVLLYVWAYGIPLLFIVCNLNYLKRIVNALVYTEILGTVGFLFVLICLSILIPVLKGTNDFTYFSDAIMTMVKIIMRMLFIVMVIVKYIPKATKETFMKYFVFSCYLYICSTIIMVVMPAVKELAFELIKESEETKILAQDARYTTRYGWAGFSGFEYTFKCALAMIFNNFLIEKKLKNRNVWFMIGGSMFLLLGTLFYGRIGSLFGIVILAVLLIKILWKRPKILIVAIICSVAGGIALLILQSRNQSIKIWFEWAFDLFVTFFRTGKLQTGSSNVLIERMLFIPKEDTILFGDGMYTVAKGYYMSTDAGIMRPLLFGGLGFAVIRYASLYFVLVLNILKRTEDVAIRTLYFWSFFLCFMFEIKGEILFSCLPIVMWLVVIDNYAKRREIYGTRS